MRQGLLRWLVRLSLFGALAGLLAYAWVSDRPSPAYPHGQFGELVLSAIVLVGLAAVATFVWGAVKGR
jgi:hypothetical protein